MYFFFILIQLLGAGLFTYKFVRLNAVYNDQFGLCLVTVLILGYELYRIIRKLDGVIYPITDARLFVYRVEHVIFGAFWWEVWTYVKKFIYIRA